MKKFIQSLLIGTTGLSLAIVIGNRPANALNFVFSQSGWEGDGKVTGVFSGEDKNGNNIIEYSMNEVSAYEMTFSDNSNFYNFTHSLDDLDNLVYNLLDNTGRITSTGDSSYMSIGFDGLAFISQDNDSMTTNQELLVTQVQVPESTSWIALVLFAFGAYFKRQQKS